eukprot:5845495-Pleurochrysis_carterae.AAC.2
MEYDTLKPSVQRICHSRFPCSIASAQWSAVGRQKGCVSSPHLPTTHDSEGQASQVAKAVCNRGPRGANLRQRSEDASSNSR